MCRLGLLLSIGVSRTQDVHQAPMLKGTLSTGVSRTQDVRQTPMLKGPLSTGVSCTRDVRETPLLGFGWELDSGWFGLRGAFQLPVKIFGAFEPVAIEENRWPFPRKRLQKPRVVRDVRPTGPSSPLHEAFALTAVKPSCHTSCVKTVVTTTAARSSRSTN